MLSTDDDPSLPSLAEGSSSAELSWLKTTGALVRRRLRGRTGASDDVELSLWPGTRRLRLPSVVAFRRPPEIFAVGCAFGGRFSFPEGPVNSPCIALFLDWKKSMDSVRRLSEKKRGLTFVRLATNKTCC